ncbi:MAG: hypothetical protein DWQ20_01900 [Actinobacteria bacterium]|nr:MAG: hypothetical protein DWQ20_01900 [Actinomycetota bacterium]
MFKRRSSSAGFQSTRESVSSSVVFHSSSTVCALVPDVETSWVFLTGWGRGASDVNETDGVSMNPSAYRIELRRGLRVRLWVLVVIGRPKLRSLVIPPGAP